MVKKVKIEEMTWREIEDAMGKGKKTIIVPIGSIEQHGPYLPEGTDTFFGDALGERIARKLGNALVAPTIRPGCSGHHMGFPGTITLSPETLMRTIREVCSSLASHGFENIVLLLSHGGNFAAINAVAPEIDRELDVNLVIIVDPGELTKKMAEAMENFDVTPGESGTHAGASETSFMLAHRPELVRKELAEKGHTGDVTPSTVLSKGVKVFSPIGVFGDPRKASREAGEKIIEELADFYVQKIQKELAK